MIFKSLANPARVRLACALSGGRVATQKELAAELGWPQSSLARHVAALRSRGLVLARRGGNQVWLELDREVTPRLLAAVCEWVDPETGERFASALTRRAEDLS